MCSVPSSMQVCSASVPAAMLHSHCLPSASETVAENLQDRGAHHQPSMPAGMDLEPSVASLSVDSVIIIANWQVLSGMQWPG